tara:strand:+ start:260 stop:451 length:192 start_codon:yes stop_codon:yes gene_type:complete
MNESKDNKIKLYDSYIMKGGDMTLDEIETFVKKSLGVSDIPLKMDMFDDFMTLILEELNNRNN